MASKSEAKRRKRLRLRRQQEAHLTQLEAERRYREALQRILDAIGLPDLIRNLPAIDRAAMLLMRVRAVRIEPLDGTRVPRRVLAMIRSELSGLLKCFTAQAMPGCQGLTLEDLYTAGLGLAIYTTIPDDVRSKAMRCAQEQLLPFADAIDDPDGEPSLLLATAIQLACANVNRINQTMYFAQIHVETEGSGIRCREWLCMRLHQVKPESRVVSMDGKSRPVWRIGMALTSTGIIWSSVTPAELGIASAHTDLPLQVYIQSHALIRLRERLDTFGPMLLHIELFTAFENKEIVPLGGNRALVAYGQPHEKIGYLLIEGIDGVAVVRTFLFITNSGTPEGDRLDNELRLGKMDKEFLQIDKLSTFVKTDLGLDQRVRDVFDKVGLGHLCRLDPERFGNRTQGATGYAQDFVKYMGLG